MKLLHFCLFIITIFPFYADIRFEPLALDDKNSFLFKSIETIGAKDITSTYFSGSYSNSRKQFRPVTFYPEHITYSKSLDRYFIQNRMGIYSFDSKIKKMEEYEHLPGFNKDNEYSIYNVSTISVSPNGKYILFKKAVSPMRSDIYLTAIDSTKVERIAIETDRLPGQTSGLWSPDSNYFIYQKSGKVYYFSIKDYFAGKNLSEDWRIIGECSLKKTSWTDDGHLIWVEKNIVYKAISEQFYYRSIYKHYLRQGIVLCRIPFTFDPATDSISYNSSTNRIFLVREGSSISYYNVNGDLTVSPYVQLNDTMRFEKSLINQNGEGAFLIRILQNGQIIKKVIFIKKKDGVYTFIPFNFDIKNKIENISFSDDKQSIMISSSNGVQAVDIDQHKTLWIIATPDVLNAHNSGDSVFVFTRSFIYEYKDSVLNPIFLSTADDGAFYKSGIVLKNNGFYYSISAEGSVPSKIEIEESEKYQKTSNGFFRLLSREVKKGFYKDTLYIKEIYSGTQNLITGKPKLEYEVYQPELTGKFGFLNDPVKETFEVALLFDCIKTGEGVFDIIEALNMYQIKANFFINGTFMDINPLITKEISFFNVEVGNAFQYNVNLLENKFMIDRNFIRQGLSANEEKYYSLTSRNFSPYWHAPFFVYSESIITYGKESGYQFVSYNLDSLDWVGANDKQLSAQYFMNSEKIVERVLKRLKPNQVIALSTGKNDAEREDWLFYSIDVLLAEMIRSGYSFTFVSNVLDKYRE